MARRQLRALGLGAGAIEHRLRTGSFHPVFRGVYAVGHTHLPELGRTSRGLRPLTELLELDGWEHHKTRTDRERDLLKEERVKLAGYHFHRFSYRRLRDHPDEVAHVIRHYAKKNTSPRTA